MSATEDPPAGPGPAPIGAIGATESSGNVFADLGLADPEEALAKAELARQIGALLAERGLTQAQAAALLGVDQPKVSALVRGRLGASPSTACCASCWRWTATSRSSSGPAPVGGPGEVGGRVRVVAVA